MVSATSKNEQIKNRDRYILAALGCLLASGVMDALEAHELCGAPINRHRSRMSCLLASGASAMDALEAHERCVVCCCLDHPRMHAAYDSYSTVSMLHGVRTLLPFLFLFLECACAFILTCS